MTTLTLGGSMLPSVVELGGLNTITDQVRRGWERPDSWLNDHGGDVACGGRRALLRHGANYAMAMHLADGSGPVIDVGCGTGLHSRWLADALGRPLWLVDNDADALAAARALSPSARTFSDLSEVPDGAGGIVVAMEVIEHVAPRYQANMVAELGRVARPGAMVGISTPDETHYRGGHSGYGPHVGSLSPHGLQQLIDSLNEGGTTWHLHGDPFGRQLDGHVVARTGEAHRSTGLFAAVRTSVTT